MCEAEAEEGEAMGIAPTPPLLLLAVVEEWIGAPPGGADMAVGEAAITSVARATGEVNLVSVGASASLSFVFQRAAEAEEERREAGQQVHTVGCCCCCCALEFTPPSTRGELERVEASPSLMACAFHSGRRWSSSSLSPRGPTSHSGPVDLCGRRTRHPAHPTTEQRRTTNGSERQRAGVDKSLTRSPPTNCDGHDGAPVMQQRRR